jgi:hypothetical protein
MGFCKSFQWSTSPTSDEAVNMRSTNRCSDNIAKRARHPLYRAGATYRRIDISEVDSTRADDDSGDSDSSFGGVDTSRREIDAVASCQGKGGQWTKEEEVSLWKLRERGVSWKKVFEHFPSRTEGAVRTRWHMLANRARYT